MSISKPLDAHWDVLILGTGATALTTALSALTSASPPPRVLLLDKAPKTWAGGNGYFTAGAYRTIHSGLGDILPLVSNVGEELEGKIELPDYGTGDFEADMERVTSGRWDKGLGGIVVRESLQAVKWLKAVGGVDWWLSFRRQAYQVDGKWVFWGGLCLTVKDGGKGLVKRLAESVERKGGVMLFECRARELLTDRQGRVVGVQVERHGVKKKVYGRSVVMCAGGFEANPDLRRQWMAPGWEQAHTRGTPYNTGDMLLSSRALGAKFVGDFTSTGCHSVAWDFDSPPNGGDREKTNEFTKSGYPLGVMVNVRGERFVDEGVDLRNYTYARFGRAILKQPRGVAWQIWDGEGTRWLRDEEYRDEIVRKVWADSVEALAEKLAAEGLEEPEGLVATLKEYNEAVVAFGRERPDVVLNPAVRDGLSTQSSSKRLALAKSNWALPIAKPPFLAVKVTSGITFTFGGLAIDGKDACVLREDGKRIEGLHCAGEMVGGLFYGNYPGGSGLTAGAVFGRRAGRAAAERAEKERGREGSRL